MGIARNRKALSHYIRKEITRSFLHREAGDYLRRFPQMCCYAFDTVSIEINVHGRFNKEALQLLVELTRESLRDGLFLDVGANIGNHSLAIAETGARVISMEPHPLTFRLLELNCRSRANITALNIGASDQSQTVRAVSPRENMGATSISEAPLRATESEWLFEVARIDDLDQISGGPVGAMKFDVEGHELQALRGALITIAKYKPIIVIEQSESVIVNGSSEAVELLRSIGYSHLYSIDVVTPWRTPQRLPLFVRRMCRLMEALFFGPPTARAVLRRLDRLEQRPYEHLVATPKELRAHKITLST